MNPKREKAMSSIKAATVTPIANDREMKCPHAQVVVDFLTRIGLPVSIIPGATGFVDTIEMVHGGLHVDPNAKASALLHEAGHLAVVPSRFRNLINGDLRASMSTIDDICDTMDIDPDGPFGRALQQCGEAEATAWAWAAGKHLGLEDETIVNDEEYNGEGDFIRMALSSRNYLGINGLSHAGFCNAKPNPYRDPPVYPEMAFWLQF